MDIDESKILFGDDDGSSLNSTLDATIAEGEKLFDATTCDNERYEKLLVQNMKLMGEMKKMWSCFTTMKQSMNNLQKEKDTLETKLNELNAYNRRENIEIRNISEKVNDKQLEEHCIKILASIDIYVNPLDIVGVHRLGKFVQGRTRSVIIRFVNRKHAYDALNFQNRLKFTPFKKLFVTENLCPTYRKIFNVLYKGKKTNVIDDVWSYNGIVSAKIAKEDEPYRINTVENAELFLVTAQSRRTTRNNDGSPPNNDNAGPGNDQRDVVQNVQNADAENGHAATVDVQNQSMENNVENSDSKDRTDTLLYQVLTHMVAKEEAEKAVEGGTNDGTNDGENVEKINVILNNSNNGDGSLSSDAHVPDE